MTKKTLKTTAPISVEKLAQFKRVFAQVEHEQRYIAQVIRNAAYASESAETALWDEAARLLGFLHHRDAKDQGYCLIIAWDKSTVTARKV